MNRTIFWLLFVVVLGILCIFRIRIDSAIEEGRKPTEQVRYQPAPFLWHTLALLAFFTLLIPLTGSETLLSVFLIVSVYDCGLLLLMPLLRKWVSARVCGLLWVLPFVTIFLFFHAEDNLLTPVITIPILWKVPEWVGNYLRYIWLTGFGAVMLWHLISHFRFRYLLLKGAKEVTDETVIARWAKEQALANFPGESFQLRISTQTQTPLSIGLLHATTYVILPDKAYTPEELSLIFRHELIHIGRRDSVTKFFLTLTTAVFWFNPLMWIAMRCCADDLELSCDETVLLGYDQQTRQQYAALLLNTAADQRGFTTCLSASASALRYRLKNVVVPRKRILGSVVAGVILVLFTVFAIFCTFSYFPGTAAERIFKDPDPKAYTYVEGQTYREGVTDCPEADTEALMEYLLELQVSELIRDYFGIGLRDGAQIIVETQEDKYVLWLSDRYLRVRTFPDGEAVETCYALRQSVDWQYLTSVLIKESE